MKDSKIALALLTACAIGISAPVTAKGLLGGGVDSHPRAERQAKADRQNRKEQRRERGGEQRQSRRQDRTGGAARESRRDAVDDRRSERRERRAGRMDERRGQVVGDRWSDRHGYGKQRRFEHRVDRRLSKQHDRVRHGWRNGEITRKELKRIRKDRRQIARMERRFGSDGHYTRHERRKLHKAMDRASQRIYRAKHNHRIAGSGYGRTYRH